MAVVVVVCRLPVHGRQSDDQGDLSERGLDVGRHDGHDRRRQLLRRPAGRLRQYARLERGTSRERKSVYSATE